MTNKILVTGGAGYIGSHTVQQLSQAGYNVVIYDNLSTGSAASVLSGNLILGDLANLSQLQGVFSQHQFDAVLHFAASISVPESLAKPLQYYTNNTQNTLNLLRCCEMFGVKKFIFSSTAAVYGEPKENPVRETSPTEPINPYGLSKLMSEQMIHDYSRSSDFKYVILRYFNVAGADLSGQIGQAGKKADHLVKVVCDAALGRRPYVQIFGFDFSTPDGTGVRDFIHVEDLATAHIDALHYLEAGGSSQTLNCGYGQGYSVKQVVDRMKEVSGIDFPVIQVDRRAGDPACVVASADRIRQVLGWQPKYNQLDILLKTALDWEKKLVDLKEAEVRLANENFRLGALLLQKQLLSPTVLECTLQEQADSNYRLGEILVNKSLISSTLLNRLLLEQQWHRQGIWLATEPTAAVTS